jgi:hypothetical protein
MSTNGVEGGTHPETLSDLYSTPLVQTLLDALPIPGEKEGIPWLITIPILKKETTKEDRFIIAGYASVEVIDCQNELIPIPVLKEAWDRFKKNKYFATGSLMHTNIPIIRVLEEYTDSKGQVWKSGVDDTGLFIVAEVRSDIEKGRQTIELIKAGKLTGFSLGGEALKSTTVCEDKVYTRIDKMDLHEIAVVDRPANQPSVFTIVKAEKLRKFGELDGLLPSMIISPGVCKLGGSVAEFGQGHDFDLLIMAKKGSFIDRAIQTRIYNELRKQGKEDLWKDVHIIHEDEGLGPYTDHIDLFDLVLLRSNTKKKLMTVTREIKKVDLDGTFNPSLEKLDLAVNLFAKVGGDTQAEPKGLEERLASHYDLNPGQVKLLIQWLGKEDAQKLLPERGEGLKKNEDYVVAKALSPSFEKLDEAITRLRSNSSEL